VTEALVTHATRKSARHTRWTATTPGNSRDSRRRATHVLGATNSSRLRIAHTRSRSTRSRSGARDRHSLQELAIGSTRDTRDWTEARRNNHNSTEAKCDTRDSTQVATGEAVMAARRNDFRGGEFRLPL
jgi:hypothetical protein